MTRVAAISLTALWVASGAVAESASVGAEGPRMRPAPSPEALAAAAAAHPLSPRGAAVVESWRAKVEAVRSRHAALAPPTSTAEEIARRWELDVAARDGVTAILADPDIADERGWILAAVFAEIGRIDADSTAALKRLRPSDGWFRYSRDGRTVSDRARLLLNHSPDLAFQKDVLPVLGVLAAQGEADPLGYAKVFDRVSLREGRPQRYLTHASCVDGARSFEAVEDMAAVPTRRAEIGLAETVAETERRMRVGEAC